MKNLLSYTKQNKTVDTFGITTYADRKNAFYKNLGILAGQFLIAFFLSYFLNYNFTVSLVLEALCLYLLWKSFKRTLYAYKQFQRIRDEKYYEKESSSDEIFDAVFEEKK